MLLVVASELIIGVFSLYVTANSYHKEFGDVISSVFSDSLKSELNSAANEVTVPEQPEGEPNIVFEEATQNNVEKLKSIMSYYAGTLGINQYRFYAIADGQNGSALYLSNSSAAIDATPSFLAALSGAEASDNRINVGYMDYALPLGTENNVKYVIYIKDTLDIYRSIVGKMFMIILYSLALSLIVSFITGTMVSRSVTVPIRQLTVKAKKRA